MKQLAIYSGKVQQGICGTKTNLRNINGDTLYVGDIGMSFTFDKEGFTNMYSMSAVVESDGEFFVMGLKSVCLEGNLNKDEIDDNYEGQWGFKRVKSWEDAIDGEHWKDFGFNYKEVEL